MFKGIHSKTFTDSLTIYFTLKKKKINSYNCNQTVSLIADLLKYIKKYIQKQTICVKFFKCRKLAVSVMRMNKVLYTA